MVRAPRPGAHGDLVADGVQVGEDVAPACASRRAGRRSGPPGRARRRRTRRARRRRSTAQRRAPRVVGRQPQPAEHARAGRRPRAARRAAAGSGRGSAGPRRRARRTRRSRRSPAAIGSAARRRMKARTRSPPAAAPSRPGSRRISPSRRGTVSGTSSRPVIALQGLRVVARADQRVQRVAGEDQVVRPSRAPARRRRSGSSRRSRFQADVGEREQPRLGSAAGRRGASRTSTSARACVPRASARIAPSTSATYGMST